MSLTISHEPYGINKIDTTYEIPHDSPQIPGIPETSDERPKYKGKRWNQGHIILKIKI